MGLSNFTTPKDPNDQKVPKGNGNSPMPPGYIPGFPFSGQSGNTPSTDNTEIFINYNEKFLQAEPVMFRDKTIEQLLSILIGKNKPNALLTGPAGTGKTAIVETVAHMLATDDPIVPVQLKGYTILELPLANVVAGASLVGQLEENIKAVIEKIEDPSAKYILFIDEIHQLLSDSQTYGKIAQILKPALARGRMKVIGATTLQEANNLYKDPAFNRRFSRVLVDELTREQTLEILKTMKAQYCQHYHNQITIDDGILTTVAVLADQYRPAGTHRPDNALTLLDRSIGETLINRQVQIKTLKQKIQDNPNNQTLQTMLTALQNNPIITLTENQIQKTAIALVTGNSKRDTIDMSIVKQDFVRIKGQDDVIHTILKMMVRQESNLFPTTKPATMMFIGPSGVGKTEIAKIIAKNLTGQKPIILNMTEYSNESTINRIIGAPPGYIGSDSHAELPFDELESNPYAVILLDEFEKAHPAVQRLFYTVFDEGTLTDNRGKTIDFSKSVIIATTNAANQSIKHSLGFGMQTLDKDNASIQELSRYFDPALINRFTYKLQFNSISEDVYKDILAETYEKEVARIRKDNHITNLPTSLSDDELNTICKDTYHKAFGARPAYQAIKDYIEELVLQNP